MEQTDRWTAAYKLTDILSRRGGPRGFIGFGRTPPPETEMLWKIIYDAHKRLSKNILTLYRAIIHPIVIAGNRQYVCWMKAVLVGHKTRPKSGQIMRIS